MLVLGQGNPTAAHQNMMPPRNCDSRLPVVRLVSTCGPVSLPAKGRHQKISLAGDHRRQAGAVDTRDAVTTAAADSRLRGWRPPVSASSRVTRREERPGEATSPSVAWLAENLTPSGIVTLDFLPGLTTSPMNEVDMLAREVGQSRGHRENDTE